MSIHEWCHPTTSFSVIPFPSCPQSLSVFSNELALHIRWPKYWGFSFSISPSSEYLWKVTMLLKSSSKTIPQNYTIGYFGFPCGSAAKKSVCNAGNLGLIPRLERSPGEGKSHPFQYSGLENSMDCRVHRVAKSQKQLSDFHSFIHGKTVCVLIAQSCPILATPWTVACQTPLFTGFSRQEY